MKIWIASDYTNGRMYEVENNGETAIEIANKYGRAESGEIIHIWWNGDTKRMPDDEVYWNSKRNKYLYNKPY